MWTVQYLAELLADVEKKKKKKGKDKGYVTIHIDVLRPVIVELLKVKS